MTTGIKKAVDLCPGDSIVTTRSVVQKLVTVDRVSITWSDGQVESYNPTDALVDVTDAEQ